MTRLYAVPAWLLLLIAVGLAAAIAIGGHVALRRRYTRVDFSVHNGVAGIVLGVVGGLFTVTLAFIIAIVWQEFDGTAQRVAIETAAASNVYHVAAGLPAPVGPEVRRNIMTYAEMMLRDEWPAMREGRSSGQADVLLNRTFEDVARFRPRDPAAGTVHGATLQYLGVLHDARRHRLDDNSAGVAPFEWAILLIGAIAIVGISYLIGLPNLRTQLVLTGALAGMIMVMFVLVFELDYPFRGDLAIGPQAWQEFIDRNNGRPP